MRLAIATILQKKVRSIISRWRWGSASRCSWSWWG